MKALTFNKENNNWENSRGFEMVDMPEPVLDATDIDAVIIKMKYAGVCGSDKGLWNRAAFKDLVHDSLEREPFDLAQGKQKTTRILGHEFFGEIVGAGSNVKNVAVGDMVSGDSHITCGQCYQCQIGENNVCTNELILGISTDGIFAEQVKIPAKNLWKVDTATIRPEIAAMFDPFGNAVHAVSKFEPAGKTVAVFGCGPIGLFTVALLKHFGAKNIIAIDVVAENLEMAGQLGANSTLQIVDGVNVPAKIMELTGGVGVDVAMEMAGPFASVMNCIESTRRGGHIILFGVKDGDFTIPKFSRLITKGITMHGVIGRRIFETWEVANTVLADKNNGVAENIWKVIMKEGRGTILPFAEYTKEGFEKAMNENPKILLKF